MRRVAGAGIFLLAFGGCAPRRSPEAPTGPCFRILTYNVNYGGPAPDQALAAIVEADAHVVCLQETTPGWERFLRPRLRDRYPHMAFRHRPGAGGLAVLSRGAVEEAAYIPSPVGWFPAWVLRAETPAGRVQIMNLHLHPAVNEEGRFSLGAYYCETPELRLREIREFHSRLERGLPTVVLGDFNEGDSGSAVAWLRERGFADALAGFDTSADTWRYESSFISLGKRLDHILYSGDLRCVEARVLERGASDHFPVQAVFEAR